MSYRIDLNDFKNKYREFVSRKKTKEYDSDFNKFWRWKLTVEEESSIFTGKNLHHTWRKLAEILSKWQAFRNHKNDNWRNTLKSSLSKLSDKLEEINQFTLIEFDGVNKSDLKAIWRELGMVKVGKYNDGDEYYVTPVGKSLMLLWGQSIGFDSNNRKNLNSLGISCLKRVSWSFNEWYGVMKKLRDLIQSNRELIEYCNRKCKEEFGTDKKVPYGRFLDIYLY